MAVPDAAKDGTVGGSDAGGTDAQEGSDAQSLPEAQPIQEGGGQEAGMEAGLDVDIPDVTFYDAPNDAGMCNALANGASDVSVIEVSGTLPTGTGGTVQAGLYFLMSATAFVADAGVPEGGILDAGMPTIIREAIAVEPTATSGTFTAAVALRINDGADQTANETFVFSGINQTITVTCGPGEDGPATYTFDALTHEFHIFVTNVGGTGTNAEFVFKLQ
jgi:hypothetical protein